MKTTICPDHTYTLKFKLDGGKLERSYRLEGVTHEKIQKFITNILGAHKIAVADSIIDINTGENITAQFVLTKAAINASN